MQVTAANVQNSCHLLPDQARYTAPISWESPSSTHDHLPIPGIINQVWRKNLTYEFQKIHNLFRYRGCFIASIDTEFPGTVFASDKHRLFDVNYNYDMMKANVDATNIVQLGLTLTDNEGHYYTWEFNFSDFDIDSDPHQNKSSVEFLMEQGINFQRNKEDGIPSREFATKCRYFELVSNNHLTWVGFQSSYDFGFFIKILIQENLPNDCIKKKLPNDIHGFMAAVKHYFGPSVFDIKHIIMRLSPVINGGLDKVAETLQVARVVGKSHTAGSDSHLTLLTFVKLMDDERFLVHGSNSSIVTLQKFTKVMQHCTRLVTNHVQLHLNVPCPDPDALLRVLQFVQFVDHMILMRSTAGEEMRKIENYCRLYKCQGALYSLTSSSFSPMLDPTRPELSSCSDPGIATMTRAPCPTWPRPAPSSTLSATDLTTTLSTPPRKTSVIARPFYSSMNCSPPTRSFKIYRRGPSRCGSSLQNMFTYLK